MESVEICRQKQTRQKKQAEFWCQKTNTSFTCTIIIFIKFTIIFIKQACFFLNARRFVALFWYWKVVPNGGFRDKKCHLFLVHSYFWLRFFKQASKSVHFLELFWPKRNCWCLLKLQRALSLPKKMSVFSMLISGYKKLMLTGKKEGNENIKYICQIFKIHMSLLKNKMT